MFEYIEKYMKYTIALAKKSNNQVPVAAIAVLNNKIIGEAVNHLSSENINLHAEITLVNKYKLKNSDIFVTLEPCPMCLFALSESYCKQIFFGAYNKHYGACGGKIFLLSELNKIHKPLIFGGFYEKDCSILLKDFFKNKR